MIGYLDARKITKKVGSQQIGASQNYRNKNKNITFWERFNKNSPYCQILKTDSPKLEPCITRKLNAY